MSVWSPLCWHFKCNLLLAQAVLNKHCKMQSFCCKCYCPSIKVISAGVHVIPDLPGKTLTLDDLVLLLEELQDVRAQWYRLGLLLGVSIDTLDMIRTHDPRNQLLEMLVSWLTTSNNPSWTTLTNALRSRGLGEYRMADTLEAKYCRPKGMQESKH